jgi:crotonobetainyl-CoA:carnitine CoA-transferase CaiB-like acyl-CoA transferase
VLDFSQVLAGPLCTQYLGDMGADVIKIEAPGHGDDTRHWPPLAGDDGTIFLSVNRNKRSLAVDLKAARGREIVHRLARNADIAIESFGPGVAERLDVGYDALNAINPEIIYSSISGYGTVGPLREGKGYDVVLQAFSGMLSVTGEAGGAPVRSPFSPVDQGTGLHALIGILAGLLERGRTGRGLKVDASLFDTSLAFLGYFLQGFWQRGTEPVRVGSGHESLCPYQVFDTADKPVILGVWPTMRCGARSARRRVKLNSPRVTVSRRTLNGCKTARQPSTRSRQSCVGTAASTG